MAEPIVHTRTYHATSVRELVAAHVNGETAVILVAASAIVLLVHDVVLPAAYARHQPLVPSARQHLHSTRTQLP